LTGGGPASTEGGHLPDLGPRGEGWVVGQLALIGAVILLGRPGLGSLPPATPIGWAGFVIGAAAIVVGAWLVIRAVADLGGSLTAMPRPRADSRLVQSGIYARIRHPIYAGLMLASMGWSALTLSVAAFGAALLLVAFLDAKARREEAWLLERYDAYEDYRRRSERFVPGIY
jgi:protein-S-isoprenylcysteine O-methyltransferase Ste14